MSKVIGALPVCISYVLLHNKWLKLSIFKSQTFISSGSFWGSGSWEWLSWGLLWPGFLLKLPSSGGLATGRPAPQLTPVAAGRSLSHTGCWPHTSVPPTVPLHKLPECHHKVAGSFPQNEWSKRETPWWKLLSVLLFVCCYFCCVLLTPARHIFCICYVSLEGGHRGSAHHSYQGW